MALGEAQAGIHRLGLAKVVEVEAAEMTSGGMRAVSGTTGIRPQQLG